MNSFNMNLSLTAEEQKALHWDGIVAVCHGKFKNLAEAKGHLELGIRLKKSGLQEPLLSSFQQDTASATLWIGTLAGKKWGDLWWEETWAEMERTKKELRKVYVDLALEPQGRWRLGAKKVLLEEKLVALKKDLGMSQE